MIYEGDILRGKVMKIFSMFDGVGGFIVGLENSSKEVFQTLYSNQYEPSRKTQDAYEVGLYRFPDMEHIPTDVALIPNEKFKEMKANGVDMIVGGFPCQDYSVARSKKNELGIEGKKGVLFWEIIRATEVIKPKYLILENVDRLLKAPSNQRGRDFAIMLAAFNQLGYSVELTDMVLYGLPTAVCAYIVNFIRFIIFDKTIQASVARDEADMKAGKLVPNEFNILVTPEELKKEAN